MHWPSHHLNFFVGIVAPVFPIGLGPCAIPGLSGQDKREVFFSILLYEIHSYSLAKVTYMLGTRRPTATSANSGGVRFGRRLWSRLFMYIVYRWVWDVIWGAGAFPPEFVGKNLLCTVSVSSGTDVDVNNV